MNVSSPEIPLQTSEYSEAASGAFLNSRLGRTMVAGAASVGLAVGGVVAEAATAEADVVSIHHVYHTGSDGLWLHPNSPTIQGAKSEVMPEGSEFAITCFSLGDNVHGDNIWQFGKNVTTGQKGYAADYYLDTKVTQGNEAAQLLSQGEPECGTDQRPSTTGLQPAQSVQPFLSFDRHAEAQWALDHAKDTPPNDGSCTIFVSRALWNGGVPQTAEWNNNPTATKHGIREGSDDAWASQNFVNYMRTQPYAEVEPLGHMSSTNNNVPDAKLGDVIGYDWDNDGKIDHLDVVTGFSADNSQYPLVSGWSEDGDRALNYKQRGWTWSAKHNTWLQSEPGQANMTAELVHFRNDDDLNLTAGQ